MSKRNEWNYPEIVKQGIFLEEDKYRFHSWVMVDGNRTLCYTASNCKLEKLVKLSGKTVLLSKYTGLNKKFSYKIEAVSYNNSCCLLNLTFLNRVIEQDINRKIFDFVGPRTHIEREKYVDNYKSDLYITETDTIIEIKSVLSFEKKAYYPSNYSKHMVQQLEKLIELSEKGKNIIYVIAATGPFVKQILVNANQQYTLLLKKGVEKGIQLIGVNLCLKNGEYRVNKIIPIEFL